MSANLVAVTACPTGIAHSQMGAEGLERAATAAGHEIRIEVQGAFGVEDDLTETDLSWADAAIAAADVRVDTDRFRDAGLPVVEIPVSHAVTDPKGVVDRAVDAAESGAPPQDSVSQHERTDGTGTWSARGLIDRLRRLL